MRRLVFYPYKMGSASCRAICAGLRALHIRVKRVRENGRYIPRRTDTLISWGNNRRPNWWQRSEVVRQVVVNDVATVGQASNKLLTFVKLQEAGIAHPEFTSDRALARRWCEEGAIIVFRRLLNSSQGRGITLIQGKDLTNFDAQRNAPLYVKYKKKKKEFRVHVFRGRVIDIQQKRKRRNFNGEVDSFIRNYDNGWVFTRGDLDIPSGLNELAISAVRAVGLDFGAVDVIWNRRENSCYILEINTAPGLAGQTIQSYINAFRNYYNEIGNT